MLLEKIGKHEEYHFNHSIVINFIAIYVTDILRKLLSNRIAQRFAFASIHETTNARHLNTTD